MIPHLMLLLCICPFAHYTRRLHTVYGAKRLYCMCCSSWLQYRICHSLSTIQYVLVPQVQRQLQAALLHASGSRTGPGSHPGSSPRPGSSLQLGRRGRRRPAEGSPQDQLRNRQCQDSGATHPSEGESAPRSLPLVLVPGVNVWN